MKRKLIIIGSIALIGILIGYQLVANKSKIDSKNKMPEKTGISIPVTVAIVSEGSTDQQLVRTGNLIPYKQAEIMATSAGKVLSVKYELGSYVNKGATIVSVDSKLKELSLQATELNINKLKKDADRYTKLLAGNAATEIQVNDTKYNYENALNQAEQIKQQISDATVEAPISGRIIKKNIEPGEFVNVGTSLGTILDVTRLKVQVMISESDVYKLKEGQHVQVKTDIYPDKKIDGVISYIAPQGDDSHNYPVEIVIQNTSQLKAGTFVSVSFLQKTSQQALLIPRSSLVESIRNPYVYVMENNIAKQRKIEVGRELGDKIEVLSGLKAGETVITTGQINLSEGVTVQAAK
ncbi:efflux RND transporter periplasmic adaptor subunit [Dyadobacter psychrotolerans]|uniref:Efflux RND transporter periplasmic adaptor subunit n=1 Tax=Dyadobacter psychrotolerans TaxID=2541721 RepID=A0A4R5DJT6_9BACT|nr:efflux RND transporter periplasmic adaptor subunit [Dyadobacter psychrotolerans]TDE13627.1 efflux RND transporter periplasmic adaptor subunit [Dyadobacter psychrotolerans]